MALGEGSASVAVALIDGPVNRNHPDLADDRMRVLAGAGHECAVAARAACLHGTFVAGILSARRGSAAPALCPGCTLLVRPLFAETTAFDLPAAEAAELAASIVECVDAGARVLNLSATVGWASARDERAIEAALDVAHQRGVAVVAAAGNDATVGSSIVTRHPWVVPVVGYSRSGRPQSRSNFGGSIGRRGLGAPGERVTSLNALGGTATSDGTSVAAPFVTGSLALLLSAFPRASTSLVRAALIHSTSPRKRSVIPPLLDAWAAYRALARHVPGGDGNARSTGAPAHQSAPAVPGPDAALR
jgi:subtilisin family serine protease